LRRAAIAQLSGSNPLAPPWPRPRAPKITPWSAFQARNSEYPGGEINIKCAKPARARGFPPDGTSLSSKLRVACRRGGRNLRGAARRGVVCFVRSGFGRGRGPRVSQCPFVDPTCHWPCYFLLVEGFSRKILLALRPFKK
jgi:hypothetical protein